jgi:hypothetical protein
MAGSSAGQGLPSPDDTGLAEYEPVTPPPRIPSFTPHPPTGAVPAQPRRPAGVAAAYPRQDPPMPLYQPTQGSQPSLSPPQPGAPRTRTPWARTATGVGGARADVSPLPPPGQSDPSALCAWNPGSGGCPQQVIRYGPGVPAPTPARASRGAPTTVPTAEQVWRTGLPPAPSRLHPVRRLASTALTVALLSASGVVIYQRLHHASFGVTGVAITQQVRDGCTVDVTGRIATTGAAGIISFQWVFTPHLSVPQPLSQSVAAGQSAVYVRAAVEGQGHGRRAQTVTLQVLGPGHGSASAHVVLSC